MSQLVTQTRSSFLGGLNRQFDPSKIEENEYPLLMNGRVREDVIETIKLPQDLSSQIPAGLKQGLVSAGTIMVAFVAGEAYYKNMADETQVSFTKIPGFLMDQTVDRIYGDLIPASTINYIRSLINAENNKDGVNYGDDILPSPNALIAMDGITQPRIVLEDSSSRLTNTWEAWTQSEREYVPIGTFPMFYSGILYCAGKDTNGKLNQILRSVTGRPLDFMVRITTSGDKSFGPPKGDAASVSGRADYNNITALQKINSTDPVFFLGTINNSYFVFPVLTTESPFAEPTFNYQFLFNTGPLNNFSLVEVLGDTLIIDVKGIVSFNATQQLKFRGNNSPFSAKINSLFEISANNYITQTITCCAKLNNYAYFAVNTIYGPSVLVYDELTQKFVSLDQWELGSGVFIKQFCVMSTNNTNRLFFITSDNKLYEAFAGEITASCKVYLGDWAPVSPNGSHKLTGARVIFSDIQEVGEASVSCYVDGILCGEPVTQPLEITNTSPQIPPITPPFGNNVLEQENVPLSFGFDDVSRFGQHIGVWVEWNSKAILHQVEMVLEDQSEVTSTQQQVIDQGS